MIPEFYLALGYCPKQHVFLLWTTGIIFQKHHVIRIAKVVNQMRIRPNAQGEIFFKT